MKKATLVLLLALNFNDSFSQAPTYHHFKNCIDTLYFTDCHYYESTKTKFINKYINQFYADINKYADFDNTKLQPFKTKFRNNNKIHFALQIGENETEILIETKVEKCIVYDISDADYLQEDKRGNWGFKVAVLDNFNKPILDKIIHFGIISDAPNAQYELIKSIKLVNTKDPIAVPDSLINDFIFPNFVNQYEGFAPIKAYYNKEKKYFAIYIYSDLEEYWQPNKDLVACYKNRGAYLVKIIFDENSKTWDRLAINGENLTRYGICNCSDFWIF